MPEGTQLHTERMDGRFAVVFGGSSGVGLACAKGMARLGARTVIVSRSEPSARRAADEIRADGGSSLVDFVVGSVDTPGNAQSIADELSALSPTIDVLVSAAGSVGETGLTHFGIPKSFATNYLAHFLLIRSLLPMLQNGDRGRVLVVGVAPALVKRVRNVSFDAVDPAASGTALLTQAIAWKLLLARHLTDTYPDGPDINVFHPGLIRSNLLGGHSAPLRAIGAISNRFAKTRCAVADHLASDPAVDGTSGRMIDNHGRIVTLPALVTTANAATTWRTSIELTESLGQAGRVA